MTALSETALSLFRSMVGTTSAGSRQPSMSSKFPPEDIRGMGLQVTRLEKLGPQTGVSSGMHGFDSNGKKLHNLFSKSGVTLPSTLQKESQSTSNLYRDFQLPPLSQLDYAVLEELDESLAIISPPSRSANVGSSGSSSSSTSNSGKAIDITNLESVESIGFERNLSCSQVNCLIFFLNVGLIHYFDDEGGFCAQHSGGATRRSPVAIAKKYCYFTSPSF